jgi:hypothetical protein
MFIIKPVGILAAIGLIVACFFPWVIIESRHIIVSGLESAGTTFGKPGLLHLVFAGLYIILFLIGRVWSRRLNMVIALFNLAWAVRNFILISTCSGGECPVKQPALYVLLAASIIMLVSVLSAPETGLPRDRSELL